MPVAEPQALFGGSDSLLTGGLVVVRLVIGPDDNAGVGTNETKGAVPVTWVDVAAGVDGSCELAARWGGSAEVWPQPTNRKATATTMATA